MTDSMVPAKQTPVSVKDFARSCVRMWSQIESAPINKRAVAVLWAQFMIETGGKYIWNYNLGNTKDVPGDGIDFHALRGTWEGVTKVEATRLIAEGLASLDTNPAHIKAVAPRTAVVFQPPHPATRFSAFKSLDEGMLYYLRLLATKRYRTAWPAVLMGDVEGFAAALKQRGYFTASAEAYTAGMRGPFNAFMKSNAFDDAVADATIAPDVKEPEVATRREDYLVEVRDRHGDVWLVSPIYVGPIGIGQAVELAERLGFELPTPELVDDIYAAADCKLDPWDEAGKGKHALVVSDHDGTPKTMDGEATHARVAENIEAQIARHVEEHGPARLVAAVFKDVVTVDGKPGIYGWHDARGKPIQSPYTRHSLAWRDYSQGLRLVKRKT